MQQLSLRTLPGMQTFSKLLYKHKRNQQQLECGPMPNAMAALPNIGGALCLTQQSLADAQYWSAVQ